MSLCWPLTGRYWPLLAVTDRLLWCGGRWALDTYVPPPATLKIRNVVLADTPSMSKRAATKKDMLAHDVDGGTDTRRASTHLSIEKQTGDPYLKFTLLEVGDLIEEVRPTLALGPGHGPVALSRTRTPTLTSQPTRARARAPPR